MVIFLLDACILPYDFDNFSTCILKFLIFKFRSIQVRFCFQFYRIRLLRKIIFWFPPGLNLKLLAYDLPNLKHLFILRLCLVKS